MTENKAVVVIIGAPASGKSRVSRSLSELLTVELIDTDHEIEKKCGPISEIFLEHGETYFRDIEREIVHEALSQHAVVSLGGGAVMNEETQKELELLPVVQMTVRSDIAQQRIANNKRPLLGGDISTWKKLVEIRQPIYDRLSSLTLDSSDVESEANARFIAQWLQNRNEEES